MSATQERTAVDAVPTQLFIGGEWRDASGGSTLDVEDPSTGEAIASVADATPDDAKAALDAACAVQDEWAAIRRASAARSCAARSRRWWPTPTTSRWS